MVGALLAKRAVANAFKAMNRHDLHAFMSGWREDGAFVYPGALPASGTFQGKTAVESWFQDFFAQFASIEFAVHDICVRNIFDLAGTNVIAAHWTLDVTNRNGLAGQASGVTVVRIRGGKVLQAKDFIFDLGEDFRLAWGAA